MIDRAPTIADREKLADDREKLLDILETPGTMEHTADALLEAGWRLIPTEGPEFDAMVERSLVGWYGEETWQSMTSREDIDATVVVSRIRETTARAFRAAFIGDHTHD